MKTWRFCVFFQMLMTSVPGSHTPHDCRHKTSCSRWDSETAAWVENMSPGRLVWRSFWVEHFLTPSSQHSQEKVAATHFCCRPFSQKTPWEFHRCRACQAWLLPPPSFPSSPPSSSSLSSSPSISSLSSCCLCDLLRKPDGWKEFGEE